MPPAEPRADSASAFDLVGEVAPAALATQAACFDVASGDNRYGYCSARRLKTPAEFAALLRAPRGQSIRTARGLLSINAAWVPTDKAVTTEGSVRFGVTVGKRNARRSVDRVLVKRLVREACRQRALEFEHCAMMAAVRIDVALRLKSPLADAQGEPLAMRLWRRQVRREADDLLRDVLAQLTERLSKVAEKN